MRKIVLFGWALGLALFLAAPLAEAQPYHHHHRFHHHHHHYPR